jgi:hypothetical protein
MNNHSENILVKLLQIVIYLVYLLILLAINQFMKTFKQIGDIRLVERMSKEQIQDYWLELKETRYDSYYYRELLEKIMKMNPNIVLPSEEERNKIEKEAINISLWEENWDKMNIERIKRGGIDYSIFSKETMWIEKGVRISNNR